MHLRDLLSNLRVTFADGRETNSLGPATRPLTEGRVWYNPGSFDLLERSLAHDDTALGFISRQFAVSLAYFEDWLERNCDCVDPPSRQRKWTNKLAQLSCLTEVAPAAIPRTDLISAFADLAPGRVAKHLSERRLLAEEEAFYAQVLNETSIRQLAAGHPTPLLCQEFLNTDLEYRAYCFADETATIKFERRMKGPIVDLQFSPEAIASATVTDDVVAPGFWKTIRSALGLDCFAADFVVEEAGSPTLLEVNPVFSWFWLPDPGVEAVGHAAGRYLGR